MALNAEQLLELAQKVLESRGFRVTQDTEADVAEEAARRERGEADGANASEDVAIEAFKTAANDYVKEE